MTASPHIEWPTGGFLWTDELRAKLPVVRGVNAPAFPLPGDPCAELGAVWNKEVFRDSVRSRWALLVVGGQACRESPWTDEEARQYLAPEVLACPDPSQWRELVLQPGARPGGDAIELQPLRCAVRAAMALHGLAFAVERVLGIGWKESRLFLSAHARCAKPSPPPRKTITLPPAPSRNNSGDTSRPSTRWFATCSPKWGVGRKAASSPMATSPPTNQ